MPRRRWLIVLAIFAALLVAVEITVRRWESPKACLQITNDSDGILEDVVVVYADTRMPLGPIARNQSVRIRLTSGPIGPLRLEYRHKGSAIQGFQIADFDPGRLVQESFKQVLVVGTSQIQRFVDDDETGRDDESLGDKIRNWLKAEKPESP